MGFWVAMAKTVIKVIIDKTATWPVCKLIIGNYAIKSLIGLKCTYLIAQDHGVDRPLFWSLILDVVDEDTFDDKSNYCNY